MASKKTWPEKYAESNKKGGIKKQTDKGLMYISTPKEIEEIIRSVPKGKLITTKHIVQELNKKHTVDFTCPLTTGIFVSVVANKAEEDKENGLSNIAPYWRVIKPKGYIYEKYLTNKLPQRKYLQKEGHKIIPSGTKQGPKVKDFEKKLV